MVRDLARMKRHNFPRDQALIVALTFWPLLLALLILILVALDGLLR